MALACGVPMLLGQHFGLGKEMLYLPIQVMVITGLVQNLVEEIRVLSQYDSYKNFLREGY